MRMAGGAYLGDTISLIAVRSSPSICTSANAGTHTRSSPLGATYPRAMAIAFTAWLIAAAPMAWSSAVPFSRTTPASAPATAVGFDLAATLRMFMGACLLGGVGGNSPPPRRGLFLSWAFWRILPLRSRPLPLHPRDPLNGPGVAGPFVHVDEDGVQLRGPHGHVEPRRQLGEEALEHLLAAHPDDRVPRPGHADVRNERGAARKDALIGRLDVGVRPHHRGDASIEIPPQGGLLGGRLGVHVDDEHGRLLPEALHQLPAGAEGRVEGLHEDPAFQVHHPHRRAAPRARGTEDAGPPSGGAGRVVRGPQQTQIAVEQGGDLPGLPGVVAPGHHVDAGGHDLLERLAGDPEPAGGILSVGDREVDRQLPAQTRSE